MRKLLALLVKTMFDISYFMVLLVLIMYIFALLGMQMFANQYAFDEHGAHVSVHEHLERGVAVDIPRAHYDTLLWSMTTVFQVLSGENWNTVMYDCIRSVGWIAVAYYLALIIVGMFVVLNLFLAILLNNFSGLTEDDDGEPGTLAPKKLEPESPGGSLGSR